MPSFATPRLVLSQTIVNSGREFQFWLDRVAASCGITTTKLSAVVVVMMLCGIKCSHMLQTTSKQLCRITIGVQYLGLAVITYLHPTYKPLLAHTLYKQLCLFQCTVHNYTVSFCCLEICSINSISSSSLMLTQVHTMAVRTLVFTSDWIST